MGTGRAVVLGASMAGLLAARVLSDHFERVVVVERDVLPSAAANRRGVPQGRHTHLLWGRGCSIIEGFFPGFTDGLTAAGAPCFAGDLARVYVETGGHPLPRNGQFDDFRFVLPSRALLEQHVRQHVSTIANVEICDGHDVVGLVTEDGNVAGVTIRQRAGDEQRSIAADLVVDASGRGGRAPAFLAEMGYQKPAEESLDVRLVYASQPIRLPPDALDELAVIIGPVPGRLTGMAMLGNEDDVSMLTVSALRGVEPPVGLDDIASFIAGFAPAHVVEAVRAAEPVGESAVHRIPATRWRRYDKLRRWPTGLVVMGDAMCSFNPIYAQGMTIAAIEAQLLQTCLRTGGTTELEPRFFRAAAKPIGKAWQLATGADLSLPEIPGARPLSVRVLNGYVKRVQAAARNDAVVARQLTRVIGLADDPELLLRPTVAMRSLIVGPLRSRS
jgi:2-polyprenyl-6-methoxyphenol hydroxylase-like FAD-dependent oxidoreductase